MEKCYKFESNRVSCKIFDKTGKLLAIGEKSRGNLFYLNISSNACTVASSDKKRLWNRRLCHVNFDNLVKVGRKNCVRGLPPITKPNNVTCKDYQLGKLESSSFYRKLFTSEHVLDLVHTDLCGPMRTKSVSGDKYFMLFIDNFSRMMWIVYLKENLEAFYIFEVPVEH